MALAEELEQTGGEEAVLKQGVQVGVVTEGE